LEESIVTPLEEMTDTHAKVIPFLQTTQDRPDTLLERAYTGLRSYGDYPVALHRKVERSSTWADVPGLCAIRVHRADTLDSHVRSFRSPDAQVVHAGLTAIVMNDDLSA
jgi:hypothetical protein